jgi:hypothetical protein
MGEIEAQHETVLVPEFGNQMGSFDEKPDVKNLVTKSH